MNVIPDNETSFWSKFGYKLSPRVYSNEEDINQGKVFMNSIPTCLENKEIQSFISDMITFQNASDFFCLDEMYQDEFVALCLKALDYDVDIILGRDANKHLVKLLLSYDRDHEIELVKSIKDSAYEQFSFYFNHLISLKIEEHQTDKDSDQGVITLHHRDNNEAYRVTR